MGEKAVLISRISSSSSLAFKASVINLLLKPMRTGAPSSSTAMVSVTFPMGVSQEMETCPSSKAALTGFLIFSLMMMEARPMLSANSLAERVTRVLCSRGMAVL